MNKQLLDGKVAVISGGTAGIGKSIARTYLQEGAKVAILGRNSEAGENAVKELQSEVPGASIQFFSLDVSNKQASAEVLKKIEDVFGFISILVNNAGVTKDGIFLRMSEDDWDQVINVNLKSIYNLGQPLCRSMMKKREGIIINISSVVGLIGNPGQVNYAASKAGVLGATKSLAKELASRGIRVNCIAPGFVETSMTQNLPEAVKEKLLNSIPMGRLGMPDEIAKAALFLASDLSSYITGQILTVDGGMVM